MITQFLHRLFFRYKITSRLIQNSLRSEIIKVIRQNEYLYDQNKFGSGSCGTPACIAGWASRYLGLDTNWGVSQYLNRISFAMGLSTFGREELFGYVANWPQHLINMYALGERAEAAVLAIEHYAKLAKESE